MLNYLKRLFAFRSLPADWRPVAEWARSRGWRLRSAEADAGFVIEGTLQGQPWRLEWGPSHRAYLDGPELRIRMGSRLSRDLQMMLMSTPLMGMLEERMYERFTEGTQTLLDTDTPEEMRWLVMFQKPDLRPYPALRNHMGVVSANPAMGLGWLDGALAQSLKQGFEGAFGAGHPLLVMTLRGRVYLRTQMAMPDVALVAAALAIFEAAATSARQLSAQLTAQRAEVSVAAGPDSGMDSRGDSGRDSRSDSHSDWHSTGATAWQSMGLSVRR